jgi:pseudaminic acid biosynthesis-associated methylase
MEKEQLKTWKSNFGVEYTVRNKISPDSRVNAFKSMITGLNVNKILEIGCNIGHNLMAISKIGDFQLTGLEPSKYAVLHGRSSSTDISILEGNIFDVPFKDGYFELVFTSGVLIHISLADLPKAIDEMYRVSNKYILVIECYAEDETVIPYRGHNALLWKRDFKKHFLERYPNLKLLRNGYWDKADGFDRTHWWLFEK